MKGDAGRVTRPGSIDLEQFAEASVGAVIRAIDARFQGLSGQVPSNPFRFPGPIIWGIVWNPQLPAEFAAERLEQAAGKQPGQQQRPG
jgi:hypothetical protein